MAQVVAAIGLIGSLLGIWSFGENHLPKKPKEPAKDDPNKYATVLRITPGLNGVKDPKTGGKLGGAGGTVGNIQHYDNVGDMVAADAYMKRIDDGDFVDVEIRSSNGHQAARTVLWGNADDICVATLAATFSDGTKFGLGEDLWTALYMSNGKSPWCTWIVRRPGQEKTPATKISVEWPKFQYDKKSNPVPNDKDAQKLCGSAFKAWDENDKQILAPNKKPKTHKRGNARIYGRSDDRLIVSNLEGQSATELCNTEHSYGPDFVSLRERAYCNMETGEVLPLCTADVTEGCFDVDTASRIVAGGHKPIIQARNPTETLYWG